MEILDIIDFGNNGEGIAKLNGKVYFVPHAMLGEKVKVEVTKEKSSFNFCKLQEVITPSPKRVKPTCPYFEKCGGCNLQHIESQEQLNLKKYTTQNTINKISKLNVQVDDIVKSNMQLGYRNKMVFAINKNGDLCMHDVDGKLFKVKYCQLTSQKINEILSIVQDFVYTYKLKGYDEKTQQGLLRYLVVRELGGKFLITLVASQAKIKNIQDLVLNLKNAGFEFGLFVNVNKEKGSLILTNDFVKIDGLDHLEGEYISQDGSSIKYPISPGSFMQVNNDIKDKIYNFAQQQLNGASLIIDAYSGSGLMTAIMSKVADQVVGLEIVKSATIDADNLKRNNNIKNMNNINCDCVVGLDKVATPATKSGFCVILDPPRKGADQTVLNKLISKKPEKILYISCNPATLARDLKILAQGYDIASITLYDMFPNTSEIETVALLKAKN